MCRFFWSFAKLISVLQITVASANHQVNSCWFFGSKGEMQRIVSKVVTLDHLLFQDVLVTFVMELATAKFDLGPVSDELTEPHFFVAQSFQYLWAIKLRSIVNRQE